MGSNYFIMFPEYKFAIVKFQTEALTYQEAIRINKEYKSDPNFSNILYLLVMIDKNCIPHFKSKDLKEISDIYNTEFQTNNHKTIVWLVSTPLITAFAHIFVSKTKDNSIYCSTIRKAYDLLNIEISFADFKLLINKQKTL